MSAQAAPETYAAAELSGLVGIATRVIAALGEVGVGVLTLVETVVPPIPSEVVLPLAGFMARQGELDLVLLVVASTVGAYVGALILYLLAARLGHDRATTLLARLPLVDRDDFLRATTWFRQHGRRSVLFGRLVPGVRSLVSLPAGAVRMPLGRFSLMTLLGSAVWNGLLIGLGWALGSRYELVEEYSGLLDRVVVVAAAGLVGWLVVRRVRRSRARSGAREDA